MSMELDRATKGRRSIRGYTAQPVPVGMIRQVLEAGTGAPSAKNGQQWRFTVLIGDAKKRLTDLFRSELEVLSARIGVEQMGSSFSSCRIMEQALVVVMVWNAGDQGWETEAHSVAAAIQNMLLKAFDLGLGSLRTGDIYCALGALSKHLDKPWKLMATVTLGWPASIPGPRPRLAVDKVTEFLS